MSSKSPLRAFLMSMLLGISGLAAAAPESARQSLLTQHLREEVRAAQPVGSLAAEQVLHFDVVLPPAAPAELDRFLASIYDSKSPTYRHFLTPAEFTARFGPSQSDWDELVRFAQRSGFTIRGGSRDEMDLRLTGTVRSIESALHVKMRLYKHPTEARNFYSPDAEPSLDLKAAVWHISGLDDFSLPHARIHARPASVTAMTTTGACPGNSYCGSDMRAAYYGGNTLTGAGQSVGLLEFSGYDSADLATYYTNAGQTNKVPVNGISTDGTTVNCLYSTGCDDTEQVLDMTQALGMAPGLAQLNVYVGHSDTAILAAMSVAPPGSVTGKVDAQLSCSWGWGPSDPGTDDPYFKKFAAQGQSFFTAAGDSSAYNSSSTGVFPADDANVTVVGGTDLSTNGPASAWVGETAWSDGGGGYYPPDAIAIPTWQSAAIAAFDTQSGTPGSTTLRNSPDVAAEANFDFYVCADQKACSENRYGGTSFAAPMWAGYLALANQQAAAHGLPPVGFLNPTLYALGVAAGTGYSTALHDVTSGSNGFPAVPGFDLATGWGSPNGVGLINALAATSAPGFTLGSSGTVTVPQAGTGSIPVTTSATGGFSSAIKLAATGQPAGVTVNVNPASITGSGSAVLAVQVAASVPSGSYPITVTGTSAATGGTSAGLTSKTTVVLNVTVPNFSLSANAAAISVAAGNAGTLTLASSASGGFNAAILLGAVGQPTGVTAVFSPASLTATGNSTLTLQVAASTPAGSYPIILSGTSGSLVHTTSVTLTVTAPSFSLAGSVASLNLAQGSSGSLSLTIKAAGGFAAPVALSAAGPPSGVSVNFSPPSISGAGSSTVTFTVASTAVPGSYPIVLTATSGALKQTVPVTLSVGASSFTITAAATSLTALQGVRAQSRSRRLPPAHSQHRSRYR